MSERGDIPTVSYLSEDGLLAELVHDAATRTTALAVRQPDGSMGLHQHLDLSNGERLVPYSARNNLIATGCVKLASDIGAERDVRDLAEDVRTFLRRYADLSPLFEDIAVYYVLLTWVHDAFNELPYLRFRGDYGSGKTRCLLTVGSLCYKPFFASGASTVSPIFHILDVFQGTLVLDEADFRFSDATAELTKVLNQGNMKGLPVLRTMTNRHRELNPTAFRVFGPKLIAMREHFSDKALESRFLTEEAGSQPLRSDIPIHLPDTMEVEAQALRNCLLRFRMDYRFSVSTKPERAIAGVEPRLNQTALALLSLIEDADMRERIGLALSAMDKRRKDERSQSEEAAMLAILLEAFERAQAPFISISEISYLFNSKALDQFQLPLSNKRIGWFVRTRLRLETMKSNGVYVIPQSQRPRIEALARRFGVLPSEVETA